MKKEFKDIIRKIPGVSMLKPFYDWKRERRLEKRVEKFLQDGLSFTDSTPPSYFIGHEPTIRCNLKCKMCYQGKTRALRKQELNTSEVIEVYKRLAEKAEVVKLVGGEPLVKEGIFDFIDFWDKKGVRVILQSNCTLINENNINDLKKFKNVSDILTSLDGPEVIHDEVRGVPGTFAKLKKAISLIRENMPNVPLTVSAVLLCNDNLDKLYELIDTARNLGIKSMNIVFEQVYSESDIQRARNIFKNVFGWKDEDYRFNTQTRDPLFPPELNSKELRKKLAKVKRYGLRKGFFVNYVPFNYYNNLDKYLGEKPVRPFCLKLLSPELRINQEGNVIWCDVIEKSFGNLLEKSPDEIWLSEEYQKFRKYLFENSLPICHRCCKVSYINKK